MARDKVLVTGGAGYIGSHTVVALLEAGHDVVVLDNLSNSSEESLRRIGTLCGRDVEFVCADVRDQSVLDEIFLSHRISAVLHFAGLKSVPESVQIPLDYYLNNVAGTTLLCQAMARHEIFRLVFSSSATVYGQPGRMPIAEDCPAAIPANPYGATKLVIEDMLRSLAASDPRWRIALLRYFNPVGAHASGEIGEDPKGIPNNLVPYISRVAAGKLSEVRVFGDDYPTPDGTGVRDYVHVVDLAAGHLDALAAISARAGIDVWNLGSGRGYSVLEIIRAFERASGKHLPYRVEGRRAGDVAISLADISKARVELGWTPRYGLEDMMRDTLRWQTAHPEGYRDGD